MSFYLFKRYFFSSRSESLIKVVAWIAFAGMTISVAALILIVSVMEGFGQAIRSRLLSEEPHLVIDIKDNPFLSKNKEFVEESSSFSFSDLTEKQKEGITESFIFESQDLILKSSEGFKAVSAIGYSDPDWKQRILSEWDDIDKNTDQPFDLSASSEVFVSYKLSIEMGLFPGDEIILIPILGLLLPPSLAPPVKQMKVRGIVQEVSREEKAFSIYYPQGSIDFGDFSRLRYEAEIKLKDPEQTSVYQDLFKEYESQTWIERNSNLFFALKLEKFMMTLFFTISLLISSFGISSALFLFITKKKQDFAIFYAMGLSQKDSVKIFVKIGLYLSFIALLTGLVIGLLGTGFLKYSEIRILPEEYKDSTIPAVFELFQYGIIFFGTLLISYISCYLPTKYFAPDESLGAFKNDRFLKVFYKILVKSGFFNIKFHFSVKIKLKSIIFFTHLNRTMV